MGPRPVTGAPAGRDEMVVLVDEDGADIGQMGKLEAHRAPGRLHRAISVVVFTPGGQVVLQRRAAAKYHFAGLWSNTCCSHPRPGEAVAAAASRRLVEEMGLSCALEEVGAVRYEAHDSTSGLVERELDVVLLGMCSEQPVPDPNEVSEVGLASPDWLFADIEARPARYTPWLREVLTVATEKGIRLPS